MTRARSISTLTLVLGLAGALTACGQEPEETTAPTPTTATSSAPTAATDGPAATTPATSTALVLGPDGLGALTLGMDSGQAAASDVVKPFQPGPSSSGCMPITTLSGAPAEEGYVYISPDLGVAAIEAYPGIETPEGIAIGSPVTAVDQAYPDWEPDEMTMRGYAPVPGNDEAEYRIAYDGGEVTGVTLQLVQQDCYE